MGAYVRAFTRRRAYMLLALFVACRTHVSPQPIIPLPVSSTNRSVAWIGNCLTESREVVCPSAMVFIPSATVTLGASLQMSSRSKRITEFCLDQTEVTVESYQECVASGRCTISVANVTHLTAQEEIIIRDTGMLCDVILAPLRNERPVACVTYTQAAVYCAYRKARLPTRDEWEFAAHGCDGRRFPWGNGVDSNVSGPVLYQSPSRYIDVGVVGSGPGDISPFNVRDLASSVSEWTQTTEEHGVWVAGGSYLARNVESHATTFGAFVHPDRAAESIGFRCAAKVSSHGRI